MGVYEGLLEIRNQGIPVVEISGIYPRLFGQCLRENKSENPSGLTIYISSELSIERKVRTLIHEIFHFTPEFIEYFLEFGYDSEEDGTGNYKLKPRRFETRIDQITDEVYEYQPVLRDFLREYYFEGTCS